jgi:hypothetical protein
MKERAQYENKNKKPSTLGENKRPRSVQRMSTNLASLTSASREGNKTYLTFLWLQ